MSCVWIVDGHDRYCSTVVDIPECIIDVIADEDKSDLIDMLDDLYTNWSADYCPFCGEEVEPCLP